MSEVFKDIVLNMAEATPEPEDYTGEGFSTAGSATPRSSSE